MPSAAMRVSRKEKMMSPGASHGDYCFFAAGLISPRIASYTWSN